MRQYIFTEKDRELLEAYFRGGKLEGVTTLKTRLKRSKEAIRKDYQLFEKAIKFVEQKKNRR